jgi:L-threonylcarbamoyladenylate synthase
MPGAITLLLKKNPKISDLVTSGSERVALRIPKHALALELLNSLDFPLAAPSANPFGYISPTSSAHVSAQLGDKISLILDGGDCQIGVESTIVGEEKGEIIIYRKGGIAVEAIQNILGKVRIFENSSSNPQAPGMLKSHYAPKVNFVIGKPQDFLTTYSKNEIGFIAFANYSPFLPEHQQLILSPQSSTSEAASHLFAYMREMDSDKFKIIVAELVPEEGLGAAVNDRLKRAAAK